MNFKTILAVLGVSTIALGKAVKTSYTTIPTKYGNVPRELMHLFDYEIGDELGVGIENKSCLVNYYQEYCNEDITSDKVDKSKYKKMKKHFDMGGKSQEEMCKIIMETCGMLSPYYNPVTGSGRSRADLYTLNGNKIPDELLSYFNYRISDDGESRMVINGNSRTIFYKYQDNCGEDFNSIDREKESVAREEFPDYSQEEICEILKETYQMIRFNYNYLTGEGRKLTGFIPKELTYLFDYEVGDEMGADINKKTCLVNIYQEYCNEDITSDKVDKSKYKKMKKNFDMEGKSQEEMCETIKDTCDMIISYYNPLTGDALPLSKMSTNHGEIPAKLLNVFHYSAGNEEEAQSMYTNCRNIYADTCSDTYGKVSKSKKENFMKYFKDELLSQKVVCPIIKDTCEMIDSHYNRLSGDAEGLSIEVN